MNKRYTKPASELVAAQYLSLMSMQLSSLESVEEYVSRADECLAILAAAAFAMSQCHVFSNSSNGLVQDGRELVESHDVSANCI